eukprot:4075946-Prymnesium_polylepis.1
MATSPHLSPAILRSPLTCHPPLTSHVPWPGGLPPLGHGSRRHLRPGGPRAPHRGCPRRGAHAR